MLEPLAIPSPSSCLTRGLLVSVLMPVYNERATIREILARVQAIDLPKEIVVVDDGSTDGTRQLLREVLEDRLSGVRVQCRWAVPAVASRSTTCT